MEIVLIFVNVVIFLLLAPLFDGVIRKLAAKVQSRQGPPIVQPYYDILKLLGKQNFNADNAAFKIAPLMAFASILSVIVFIPLGNKTNWLTQYADVITIIYMLTLGGVAVILGGLSSKNTYAAIGASREMITMIMVEPVLAMTLIMGAIKVKGLGIDASIFSVTNSGYSASVIAMIVAFILALQAFVGRQPFDIVEAEQEIIEGPFIEYSGPNLALFKYYIMLKQMFYAALFVLVFIPGAQTGFLAADIAIQMAEVLGVIIFIALIGTTNPRLRIDQAIKYYMFLIAVSLCAIGLSVYGL